MELDSGRSQYMAGKNVHQWSEIFRALGNPYRLQIIKLLDKNEKMSVSFIKEGLDISFKNTSRNLGILRSLDILKSKGKSDHVFYEINPEIEIDVKNIIKILTK